MPEVLLLLDTRRTKEPPAMRNATGFPAALRSKSWILVGNSTTTRREVIGRPGSTQRNLDILELSHRQAIPSLILLHRFRIDQVRNVQQNPRFHLLARDLFL